MKRAAEAPQLRASEDSAVSAVSPGLPAADPDAGGGSTHPPVLTQGVAVIPSGTIAYTTAGQGPVVLLVHGLGGTRETWVGLIERLARTHTVLAADLPGHGASDAPAGDYSLGAHATALRDLLMLLDLPAATVIGHSLGGGVAMQFAYQFPQRVERLVLISSGGLGPEVAPFPARRIVGSRR